MEDASMHPEVKMEVGLEVKPEVYVKEEQDEMEDEEDEDDYGETDEEIARIQFEKMMEGL